MTKSSQVMLRFKPRLIYCELFFRPRPSSQVRYLFQLYYILALNPLDVSTHHENRTCLASGPRLRLDFPTSDGSSELHRPSPTASSSWFGFGHQDQPVKLERKKFCFSGTTLSLASYLIPRCLCGTGELKSIQEVGLRHTRPNEGRY